MVRVGGEGEKRRLGGEECRYKGRFRTKGHTLLLPRAGGYFKDLLSRRGPFKGRRRRGS